MRILTRSMVIALAASLAVACGGGGGGGDGGGDGGSSATSVTLVGTEFSFDPAQVTISAGTDVTISLQNAGVVEHDITIDELGLEVYADPGQTTSGTINAAAGTYTFYCSIPGHREAGMEGTLTAS